MKQLLFNTFERFAGTSALLIGLGFMLITALTAVAACTHLDGVIDMHLSSGLTFGVSLTEALINWLCMSLFIYISGLILSRSSIRIIDVIGTQAMARGVMLPAVLATWLAGGDKIERYLNYSLLRQGEPVTLGPLGMILFIFSVIVGLACMIWMILLMYKAYSVACNVKGGKAVGSFIAALILAEISSKLLLTQLLTT